MSPLAAVLEKKLKLRTHPSALINPSRTVLAGDALRFREAILAKNGALATWGPAHATGRIPDDTYTVRHEGDASVDWSQKNNHPMSPETFDRLFHDALEQLQESDRLYITDRAGGAEGRFALPVRTITSSPLTALFTTTMFRPAPKDLNESLFVAEGFTILMLPHQTIDTAKYRGVLREVNGAIVDHAIAMDFERRVGIVFGTSYLGAVKKMLFTVMNHRLPAHGVLPLHCSAVIDRSNATHLLLGLSGTGKTTLSSGPGLRLIGDDEHFWSDTGVSNIENGCYAKLIDLSREKEPGIFDAVFGHLPASDWGVIIENAMTSPDGSVDVNDRRLTENSRATYPLSRLRDTIPEARGGHPSTILFLTADAEGVLPPIAKLPLQQAMLWFLLGYTSKLAGTETGVTQPKSTFSRFFGGPFMSRPSEDYLHLFQAYVSRHKPDIYLVNTGWSGGSYGVGKRMDIGVTRRLVDAALSGQLKNVSHREDPLFHLLIPRECPGVDSAILDPRMTWADPKLYDEKAKALAHEFSVNFEKMCTGEMQEALRDKCPGK